MWGCLNCGSENALNDFWCGWCEYPRARVEKKATSFIPFSNQPPPYPQFCRHPDQCAGLNCCPRDMSCID